MADHVHMIHGQPVIATTLGQPFNFLDPDPNTIHLYDIAESLAKDARYTGKTPGKFYCVTPETKILTWDLRWIPAGSLMTGDSLLAFDEHSKGHRNLRKWRKSSAMIHGFIERDLYSVSLSDGTELICSAQHSLLCASNQGNNSVWRTAEQLFNLVNKDTELGRGTKRYLPKYVNTWEEDISKSAGWLEGMFDGEGTTASKASGGRSLSIAQNPGPILDRLKRELDDRNFQFFEAAHKKCRNLVIKGGAPEQLRLLGQIRSDRLRSKMLDRLVGTGLTRMGDKVQVLSVKYKGKGEVVALETSTHTYFTEGFASHNSVSEHSVLCSHEVPEEYALMALMHDAAEAYMGDWTSPFKKLMDQHTDIHRIIDKRISLAIFKKFGIEPYSEEEILSPEVHEADGYVYLQERYQLCHPRSNDWWDFHGDPDPNYPSIPCLEWREAKEFFIRRFNELYCGQVRRKDTG